MKSQMAIDLYYSDSHLAYSNGSLCRTIDVSPDTFIFLITFFHLLWFWHWHKVSRSNIWNVSICETVRGSRNANFNLIYVDIRWHWLIFSMLNVLKFDISEKVRAGENAWNDVYRLINLFDTCHWMVPLSVLRDELD